MTDTTEFSRSSGDGDRDRERDRDGRDRDYGRDREYGRDRDYGRPQPRERGFFISTESRPGFVTTEFWMSLIGIAALIILAFAVDEVGNRWGLVLATSVLVAYVLSRGIAKAGSAQTKRRTYDDA